MCVRCFTEENALEINKKLIDKIGKINASSKNRFLLEKNRQKLVFSIKGAKINKNPFFIDIECFII